MKTRARQLFLATMVGLGVGVGIGAGPTFSDDSVASLAAGGIVLEKTEDIALLSEDLFISRDEVRVRFEFRNETVQAIETLVAFALPDTDIEAYHKHGDLVAPPDNPANFIGFSIAVDGRPVVPTAETRAVFQGRDITEDLARAGIPASFFDPAFKARLQALPDTVLSDLADRGLLSDGMVYGMYLPHWKSRTRLYWNQAFPPGQRVTIEHAYKPVVGINPNFDPRHLPDYETGRYCIGTTASQRMKAMWDRSAHRLGYGAVTSYEVDYLLTTGGNWRGGTIDHFRLTVETGSPETVLATCHDELRKTGPKTYVVERRAYEPDQDLHLLFLEER